MSWQDEYEHLREVPNNGLCGLHRMMFTTGLFCDLREFGPGRRYCYKEYGEALAALQEWTGEGDPPGLWIKEKPGDRHGPGSTVLMEDRDGGV